MVALDLVIAELEQYLRRGRRITRGLRQFHGNATGRAADELSFALTELTASNTLAEEAIRILSLLRASSFPKHPRFRITGITQQLLTQLLHDMQEGQAQLDLVTEATIGEIVAVKDTP